MKNTVSDNEFLWASGWINEWSQKKMNEWNEWMEDEVVESSVCSSKVVEIVMLYNLHMNTRIKQRKVW